MQTLHIHLLGDFLLMVDDSPLTTVHTLRMQSLFAYLVLHRSAPQRRSHLAFLLWPDLTEAQAHANLRKVLHHLRQALPSLDQFLHIDRHHLHWQPSRPGAAWTLDVEEVEQRLDQAEQAIQAQNSSLMRQALERAVDLYRGDLLTSCYDEWILAEREQVRLKVLKAAEHLVVFLEQERDYDAAIIVAQRLLHHDPLHETTYRQLMRFYAQRGDRAAAVRVYHTCVTVLERELAVEPSEATRQAYAALLQTSRSSLPPPITDSPQSSGIPLVGRKLEWEHLQRVWGSAAGGHPQLVILSGEAGIGKTKLAEELLAWVGRQGLATASARCYAIEGRSAYGPVMTWLHTDAIQIGLSSLADVWLTEVARLLPGWLAKRPDLPHPIPLTDTWQRQHLFEALARAFLRTPNETAASRKVSSHPLLLFLDDLHWCDNETLEWIHYLLHFAPQTRLLLVGTIRTEEILPGHPLLSFLSTLQRAGLLTEIALGALSPTETTSLAEHVARRPLDPRVVSSLYSETEGNPLFVVEMVRAGTVEQRVMEPGMVEPSLPLLTRLASLLPPAVQTVLAARLAQLSPPARELAELAAVVGRAFAFAVLVHASSASEEVLVQGLDELWQRRIVREHGPASTATYDFSHDKLREEAYGALSSVRRRFLHRRVAEALVAVSQGDLDLVSGQIAVHYEQAGLPELAIPYYQRVGEVARRIYANAEAVTAFQHAITLLEASSQGRRRDEQTWQNTVLLYEDMGDAYQRTGQLQEARQAYHQSMIHVPAQELLWQARLLRKNAVTWQAGPINPEGSSHLQALQRYHEAEHILDQASNKSSREWLYEWIALQLDQLLPHRASVDDMTAVIEKTQPIVQQHGTAAQRGQLSLAVIVRDVARDRYVVSEQTVSSCRKALTTIQQGGKRVQTGYAYFALGTCLMWSGHLDQAEEQLRAALRVGEHVQSATLLARCLTFLPFIPRQRGQVEAMRRTLSPIIAMPEMQGNRILTGHRAWVAWRDGDLVLTEKYGQMLLEDRHQQQQMNAFYWTGLWPLLGVMFTREKLTEAMDCVRILLDPTQQPPPEPVRVLLESALKASDTGHQEEMRAFLHQAMPLAAKMGYL